MSLVEPNEHGVYVSQEDITEHSKTHFATIHIVQCNDMVWRFGIHVQEKQGSYQGTAFYPSIHDKGYGSREAAIASGVEYISSTFAKGICEQFYARLNPAQTDLFQGGE